MTGSEEKVFANMEPVDPFFYCDENARPRTTGEEEEEEVQYVVHVVPVEDDQLSGVEPAAHLPVVLGEVEPGQPLSGLEPDQLNIAGDDETDDCRSGRQEQLLQLLATAAEQEQQQQQQQEHQPQQLDRGVTGLQRNCRYSEEQLNLDCDWDFCSETFTKMDPFMAHVSGHILDAEIRLNHPPQEDSFVCLWEECGFETATSTEMVRHINFHSFHTKIKCHGLNMLQANKIQPCQLDSSQKNILPDLSEPFKCEWEGCDKQSEEWTHAQKFYWHVAGHAEEVEASERVCQWANCMKKVAKFKDHVRSHAQEKRVGCPTCGGLFATRVKFLDHCKRQEVENCENQQQQQQGRRNSSSSATSFTCSNCAKTFALERLLRDHVRSHINHHRCPHCDMTCPTPSTLASHIRYRHLQERAYSCARCDYRGKSLHDLKAHARLHGPAEEAVLACQAEGCSYTCRSNAVMKNHVLKVHVKRGPSYACHLCDKLYNRGSYLTRHLIRDHEFTWPSGHSRFRYNREEATGLYRLQTIRFESVELQGEQLQEEEDEGLIIAEERPRSLSPECDGSSSYLYRTSSPCPPPLHHYHPLPPPPSSSAGLTPATLSSPAPSSLIDGDLAALPLGSHSFRDEVSSRYGGGGGGGSSLRDEAPADQQQQQLLLPPWPAPGDTGQTIAVRRSSRRRESMEFECIASGAHHDDEDERSNKPKKFKYWK